MSPHLYEHTHAHLIQHLRETDPADLEIHEVTINTSLSTEMTHIIERIISRKCNIHVKYEI
jgi:hypothetical protein